MYIANDIVPIQRDNRSNLSICVHAAITEVILHEIYPIYAKGLYGFNLMECGQLPASIYLKHT
jgi:hypothetical protein